MHQLTPREPAWIDDAPARCTASTEVAAAPETVWSVLTDHQSWPTWFPTVRDVAVTGAATGVGARRRVGLTGLQIEEEFTQWDAPSSLAFTVVSSSRRLFDSIAERLTLEPDGAGGTHVTYVQAFDPAPWFRLPFVLVRRRFEQDLRRAVEGLARRCAAAADA